MKTLIRFTVFALPVLFFCNYLNAQDAKTILADPKQRGEIFSTMLNDHQLMTEFIEAMGKSEHGKMMMSNSEAMKKVLAEDAAMRNNMMGCMISIAAKDNQACAQMCDMMMKDENMYENIKKHPRYQHR